MAKESKSKKMVTVYWNSDAAESDISMTAKQWSAIQAGGEHIQDGSCYFDGQCVTASWSFKNRHVSIEGGLDGDWLVGESIGELYVEEA